MSKSVGFGTGGMFGGGSTDPKKSVFNFGGSASTSAPAVGTATPFGGGFGAKTTGSSLFGTTSTAGFGGTDAKKPSAFNFGGATASSAPTLGASTGFGSGFGAKGTASGTGFNFSKPTTGFGASTGGGLFGQPQQQLQQQAQANTPDNAAALLLNTATALSAPLVFGDERDAIIMKWNQIQAFWGTGKGYYRKDGSHINFDPQNHFCHFKAVGYSCLPTMKDSDGFVSIVCNKKESEMRTAGENNISSAIHKILGANASLTVKVDSIRPLPDDKCELTIYVSEQSSTTGAVRRVLASELHRYMQQNNIQQQLNQQVLMEACVPRVAITTEQIERILANPPAGIDPVIWEQAKKDNPDPQNLIPVPMIGFAELRNRLQHQEFMSKQHQSRLDILSKGLHDIQQEQVNAQSKIEQHKRKLLELSHRVLKVIISQEIIRKAGYAIQPEEEQLRVQLDAISNQLNAPTQFRVQQAVKMYVSIQQSRLNELLSQVRMRHHAALPSALGGATTLDPDSLSEIQTHLRKQQEGLSTLVKIVTEDFQDLSVIERTILADDQTHEMRDSSAGYHGYRLHSYR